MKRTVLVGLLTSALALSMAPAQAQSQQTVSSGTRETTPQQQPPTEAADTGGIPTGETNLGAVRIPKAVKANGEPLSAGTYQVRLTAEAGKAAPGATEQYERWVEFLQGGQVKGKEMASVVPNSEIRRVAESGQPAPGRARVDLLRGGEYYRVWIRRGANNYLIHLPAGS